MTAEERIALAARLARGIFEVGDERHDKVQRIQFLGGRYPDDETKLGGLAESSLADYLDWLLERYAPKPGAGNAD